MKRRHGRRPFLSIAAVPLAAASLLLAACSSSSSGGTGAGASTGGAKNLTQVSVLLGSPDALSNAALYVATGLGYFSKMGIQVTVASAGGSATAWQSVAHGSAQFAWGTPEPVIVGAQASQHLGLQVVYTIVPNNFYYVAVPSGSSITSVSDLKGKTIGFTSLSSGSYIMTRALLASAGLNPDTDVHYAAIGTGAAAAEALKEHRVDAMAVWDALSTVLGQTGSPMKALPLGGVNPNLLASSVGIGTTAAYAKAHPDVVAALGRGMAEATAFMMANPTAAVQVAWKVDPNIKPANQDEAAALKSGVAQLEASLIKMPKSQPWGQSPAATYNSYVALFKSQGVITQPVQATSLYTNQFVAKYNDFNLAAVQEQAKKYDSSGQAS